MLKLYNNHPITSRTIIATNNLPHFKIEQANKTHISQLRNYEILINQHLESSPIFLKRTPEEMSDEKLIEDYLGNDKISLVALMGGKIVSCIRGKKNHGNIPI